MRREENAVWVTIACADKILDLIVEKRVDLHRRDQPHGGGGDKEELFGVGDPAYRRGDNAFEEKSRRSGQSGKRHCGEIYSEICGYRKKFRCGPGKNCLTVKMPQEMRRETRGSAWSFFRNMDFREDDSRTRTLERQEAMNEQYNTIEEAIEDLRAGKIILVTDDPDRENEGDMICAAEFATQANINFMASHAKGLICTPMSAAVAERLGLPQMVSENTDNHCTAFTVSIDHVDTTTGNFRGGALLHDDEVCGSGDKASGSQKTGTRIPACSKTGRSAREKRPHRGNR